jgi:hypothetical protein
MNHSYAQQASETRMARTVTHQGRLRRWALCVIYLIALLVFAPHVRSASDESKSKVQTTKPGKVTQAQVQCLPSGDGYVRAKLNGAINAELNWGNATECAGSVRPDGGGVRLRFSHADKTGNHALVLLFGISGLHEGAAAKALPVNVTVIREGSGEFYSTQGDSRCTIDEVHQQPLSGVPLRKRSYRVEARGFCTQPARAVNGDATVLITRFDFAGRAEFESDGAEINAADTAVASTMVR